MSPPLDDHLALTPTREASERACAVCGQRFDLNDLAQAYHHNDEPHDPLPD
jgi:hypothetical protein